MRYVSLSLMSWWYSGFLSLWCKRYCRAAWRFPSRCYFHSEPSCYWFVFSLTSIGAVPLLPMNSTMFDEFPPQSPKLFWTFEFRRWRISIVTLLLLDPKREGQSNS
jgi:hypothetical protein